MTHIYKWNLTLTAMSPFHIGDHNSDITVDQFGFPIIPGTSLAGACRSFVEQHYDSKLTETLFGSQSNRKREVRLIFTDGEANEEQVYEFRTGIAIDGKTKTTKEGHLFERILLSPGTDFSVSLTLKTENKHDEYKNIIDQIIAAIDGGHIRLGAYQSTGSGVFSVSDAEYVHYNCANEDDLFAYVNNSKQFVPYDISHDSLHSEIIEIELKGRTETPLLIGGQYPLDSSQPDETFMSVKLKNKEHPVIPGSSLKGVFRHQVERITNVLQLDNKTDYISHLFGSDTNSTEKKAATVLFQDTVVDDHKTKTYHRIAINPLTGSVREGAVMEEEVAVGSFSTVIQYNPNKFHDDQGDIPLSLLIFAVRDLAMQQFSIGSGASIGRGYLHIREITIKQNENEIKINVPTKHIIDETDWLGKLDQSLQNVI